MQKDLPYGITKKLISTIEAVCARKVKDRKCSRSVKSTLTVYKIKNKLVIRKEDIDKYFTKNEKDLLQYIKSMFSKRRIFNEDPHFFLSELYLYIIDKQSELESEQDIHNYCSTFIYKHCTWVNSKIRESERKYITSRQCEFIPELHESSDEDDQARRAKILLDDEYKTITELYYQSLTTADKKAIWEIYFIHKKQTITAFAEYIKLSRSVANKLIKELKRDLNEFYEKYKASR